MENSYEKIGLSASEEKQIKKLKEKGFKNYTLKLGEKIKDNSPLVPFNCKNLVGHKGNNEFFVQTNKGKEMATKLLLREMRATDKQLRLTRKDIKEYVAKLKKLLPQSSKSKKMKDIMKIGKKIEKIKK